MKVELKSEEIVLLVEALARAASRHDSEARFYPRVAKPHKEKAKAMRELGTLLTQYHKEVA